MTKTLCVDLVSHATLFQSSQSSKVRNNNETKNFKERKRKIGRKENEKTTTLNKMEKMTILLV
jgi:hypothetical protein